MEAIYKSWENLNQAATVNPHLTSLRKVERLDNDVNVSVAGHLFSVNTFLFWGGRRGDGGARAIKLEKAAERCSGAACVDSRRLPAAAAFTLGSGGPSVDADRIGSVCQGTESGNKGQSNAHEPLFTRQDNGLE